MLPVYDVIGRIMAYGDNKYGEESILTNGYNFH